MNEAPQDSRMPRGVLAVLAVGLIATLAAALLATGKGDGEAAHLEFVQVGTVPDSEVAQVPGGGGTMQLTEGRIQATGSNFSGYSLFRVATTLSIDEGAPVGGGRILCKTRAIGPTAEIGRSSEGLRALYPRSSEEGIWGQGVPETLLLQFSSHGGELAVLEVDDLKQRRFTTIQGVKVEWPEYDTGPGQIKYFLPDGKPKVNLRLPFYSVWKSKEAPRAKLSCGLETSAGEATVKTTAALPHVSPPINEEAEAENAERREEVEEEKEEAEAGD